jgi:serine protease inhibitor ecotin
MKRTAIACCLVALAGALVVVASPSGAGSAGTTVAVLHGLGPAPSTVDVYVGETDATEWDLLLEGLNYSELVEVGPLAGGGYNILLCNAVAGPAETITECPGMDGTVVKAAVNGNFGTNIEIPASGNVTVVAAYSGPDGPAAGRPTVTVFENDVDCYEAGQGRLGARHAAAAPDVDVRITAEPGPITISDVAFGEGLDADLDTGPASMEVVLASDESNVLGPTDTPVVEGQLKIEYVVGNPQFEAGFALLEQLIDLEPCRVETTTTTTESTTTTSTTEPEETTTTTSTTIPAPVPSPQPLTPVYTG